MMHLDECQIANSLIDQVLPPQPAKKPLIVI